MKKPKDFQHGKYQIASCSEGFYCDEDQKHLPDAIFIHCEEMNLKQAKKFQKWLNDAIKWLEKKGAKE